MDCGSRRTNANSGRGCERNNKYVISLCVAQNDMEKDAHLIPPRHLCHIPDHVLYAHFCQHYVDPGPTFDEALRPTVSRLLSTGRWQLTKALIKLRGCNTVLTIQVWDTLCSMMSVADWTNLCNCLSFADLIMFRDSWTHICIHLWSIQQYRKQLCLVNTLLRLGGHHLILKHVLDTIVQSGNYQQVGCFVRGLCLAELPVDSRFWCGVELVCNCDVPELAEAVSTQVNLREYADQFAYQMDLDALIRVLHHMDRVKISWTSVDLGHALHPEYRHIMDEVAGYLRQMFPRRFLPLFV